MTQYTTRPLAPNTWADFAALVEANNGVWGGCWCIGFHPDGISKDSTVSGNRDAKLTQVYNGTIHQMLVHRGGQCVGWCQYGPPAREWPPSRIPRPIKRSWRSCLTGGSGACSLAPGTAVKAWHAPELRRRWPL